MFADDSPEHACGLLDGFAEPQRTAQEDLLAAIGQKLPGECSRLFGGRDDLPEGSGELLIELWPAELHRRITEDDGEDIVEIMRHARGKATDSFHLLGLAKKMEADRKSTRLNSSH